MLVKQVKPFFDKFYNFIMFICKLLLVIDILITGMSVLGRYVPFIPDPAWSEEIILTCMGYMAVLSASLALRRNGHIRMTAFDNKLPPKVLKFLDLMADIAVFILAIVMLVVGMRYALEIGSKGSYVSIPWLSRFWKYFPVPLAGIVMLIFGLETFLKHFYSLFAKEEI